MRASTFVAVSGWLAVLSTDALAVTTEIGPADDPEAAIAALGPGDELILQGGLYTLNGRFGIDIAGTAAMPILIRAKVGERPHLMRPDASQNIVDIDNADWVTIRGIEFSGGSAGLRISAASFLTIEDCEIHETGDVALRANDTGAVYESLRFLRNHIHDTHDTGEGMYLGCNNDGCQFQNGLIEGNWVHHTNAGDVVQGDGIEIKEGSFGNVVRDNVIHDTNYPCILTYSTAGNGAPNVIERNVMWNCGDHGIQSSADAIIRNNLILSAGSDGIAMQPHQSGAPSNLVVVHNTILKANNDAISVRGNTGMVVLANNALYAQNGDAIFVSGGMPGLITLSANAGVGGAPSGFTTSSLADLVNGHYAGAPPVDLFPTGTGALPGAGDLAHLAGDDFNGTSRNAVADIGAYAYAPGGNPGWVIVPGFKGSTPVPPPLDAGQPDAAPSDDAAPSEDAAPSDDATPSDDAAPSDDATADAGFTEAGTPADAGTPDAGSNRDAQPGDTSAPTNPSNNTDRDDQGCGCRSTPAPSSSRLWLLALIGIGWVTKRRS